MKKKSDLSQLLGVIRLLHDDLQKKILSHRRLSSIEKMSGVDSTTKSDVIYKIDKVSEKAIFEWLEKHWPQSDPVELIMEGVEEGTSVFPPNTPKEHLKWKLVIDPIDGTRHLMFDKRSAWILTGLAPHRGLRNTLKDIRLSVMTELPPSKQQLADQFWAIQGEGAFLVRKDLKSGIKRKLKFQSSRMTDLEHGYAQISKFFPEGKTLLAEWEVKIWEQLYPDSKNRFPVIFDDQCLSTGGQLYELMMGHDRFIADLRPQAFEALNVADKGMSCHPYDICTSLIAQEAGVIVEKPDGDSLDYPLDTTYPVAWVGYANKELARKIRPIIRKVVLGLR